MKIGIGLSLSHTRKTGDPIQASIISKLTRYWKFNEDATDATGNGDELIATGTPTYPDGKLGKCLDFEESGNPSLAEAHHASLQPTTKLGWMGWVKPESVTGLQFLFLKSGGGGSEGFCIVHNVSGGNFIGLLTGAGASEAGYFEDMAPVGSWTHICINYDGTLTGNDNRIRMYKNGVLQTGGSFVGTIPAQIVASVANLQFGLSIAGLDYDGQYDDIKYSAFDTFSAAEIIYDYNGGNGREVL